MRVLCFRSAFVLLVFSFAFGVRAEAETKLWIDTDPSMGAAYREVDDAFALVFAFHAGGRRVAGISTTYGNAGVKRTTTVARDLVRRFGANTGLTERDVYAGSSRPRQFGQATPASEALAAALRGGRLTYVALGPLTNLATFLQLHPELAPRLDRVVFVGGRTPGRALAFGPNGALQIHDANVFKDPAAARLVVDSKVPLVLAPAETGGELVLTRDDARALAADGEAARFLQRGSRMWLWFWTTVAGHRGGPLFDSLGVIAALNPEALRMERRYASVRDTGELIAARKQFSDAREVTFCSGLGADAKQSMMRALLRQRSE